MSISKNIKDLRELHGMSQSEFGQIAGVTDKAVSTWENGLKIPRMGAVQRLSDYFGIPKSQILDEHVAALPSNAIPYSPSEHVVPILGRIPAGYPVFAASEIEGYAPVDYADVENYFWLRVNGDSMENADIHNGDLVLIRRQDCADDGQIVAARVNGDEATLKRFRRSGDTVMLVPENPKYLPIPVPASAFTTGDASIIGVVVELKRKFV